MSFTAFLFYLLSLVIVVAAFRVITARSPVTAVLHLILTFFTASMLWLLQEAEFLALLLILIYVGAVMVMFLFVIMMLDMRDHPIGKAFRTHMPLGLGIGLVMLLEMAFVLARSWVGTPRGSAWPEGYDNTRELGIAMYQQYSFAVEVGGVVLLVGMIAAIALTLRKRDDVKYTQSSQQVRVRAADRVRLVNLQSQSELPAKADNNKQGEG